MGTKNTLQAAIDHVNRLSAADRVLLLPHLVRYEQLLDLVEEMTARYDRGHQPYRKDTRRVVRRLLGW